MPKKPELTPAEWEIMDAVWDLDGPVTVRDVLEQRYPDGAKAYTTVQTTMNILERKGMLKRRKTGLVNFYSPTRPREDVSGSETSSLVSRVFGGSIPALANSLLSLDDLGLAELEEIKQMLAEKEAQLRRKGRS